MKTIDDAARARIARGWLNSSLDQATYAAAHGISERTLREWVRRSGAGRRPQAQLRATVVASIEQLQHVLAALDAEAAADSAAAPEVGPHVVEHQVERHAGAARPAVPARATTVSSGTEPLASATTVPGIGGGASALGPDGAGPAAAPCREAAPLASGHQVQLQHSPQENDAPGVLDFEALRQRAAQRRAARAASGAPRKQFDWDAE